MMICKKCKSTKIKTRRNYSHGNKSKAITSMVCRMCGSTDIEDNKNNQRRGFRRKRW